VLPIAALWCSACGSAQVPVATHNQVVLGEEQLLGTVILVGGEHDSLLGFTLWV
jgi:hypothetical protein